MRQGDLVRFREGCGWERLSGRIGLVLAVRPQEFHTRWDALVDGMLYGEIVYDKESLEVINGQR